MTSRFLLRRFSSNRVTRQSISYTVSAVSASLIGALITVIVAKALTVEGLGVYSFANALFGYLAMFFEFGLLGPAARHLPTVKGAEQRSVLGAAALVLLGLAVGFNVTLFAASYVVDGLFAVQAGDALRVASAVSLGWGLTQGCLMLAQGAERLGLYSAANLASKIFYVAVLGVVLGSGMKLTPGAALLIESATLSVTFVAMIVALRPVFGDVRRHIRMFLHDARAYGLAMYFGRVLTSGTYNLDVLLLAWLSDSSDVAFYALAASMAAMVAIPPSGVAAAIFGNLARWTAVPRRWLVTLALISVGGAVFISLAGIPFIEVFLGSRFDRVLGLLPILAVAQAVNGFTRILNNFLWAHARGRDLSAAAIVLTIANLVLNVTLIPAFGAAGAAWASLGAMVINLAMHWRGYRRAVIDMTTSLVPTESGGAYIKNGN